MIFLIIVHYVETNKRILSLWLVLFVVFLDNLGIGIVYPMFSAMVFEPSSPFVGAQALNAERGLMLGGLLAAMPISSFFSAPILGALSDQKGRKPLLIFCLSLAFAGYLISATAIFYQSILLLIFSRVVVGLADGSISVVYAAVADLSQDEEKTNKAKNFGLYAMAAGTGFAIGPFLGGILSTLGYAIPFLVAAVATLINVGLMIPFFQETHTIRSGKEVRFNESIRNLQKAFRLPELRVLFLGAFLITNGWSLFYEFLPVIWINDYQASAELVGLMFAFGAGVYAIGSGLLIRPVIDRFSPRSILYYFLLAQSVTILLWLIHPPLGWVWIYLTLINIFAAFTYPTFTTIVSNLAGNAQGEILGILGSVQAVAYAVSPLVGGALIGRDVHLPLLLGALAMLLCAFLFRLGLKKS